MPDSGDGALANAPTSRAPSIDAQSRIGIVFVTGWVPRKCGIATFARDTRDAVARADVDAGSAVAIDDSCATRRVTG